MGPVRQNPIQRTVSLFICVCIALCTIVAHNIAQNRRDSFPPYPPDNHHYSDDVYLREGGASVNRSTRVPVGNCSRKSSSANDHFLRILVTRCASYDHRVTLRNTVVMASACAAVRGL